MSTAVVAGVAGGVAGALVLGAIFVRWCLWAPVLVRAEDAEKAAGEEGRPADAGPPPRSGRRKKEEEKEGSAPLHPLDSARSWTCKKHGLVRHTLYVAAAGAANFSDVDAATSQLSAAFERQAAALDAPSAGSLHISSVRLSSLSPSSPAAADRPPPPTALTAFDERTCLAEADDWDTALENGALKALVVAPVLSAAAVRELAARAPTRRVPALLAWEAALDRRALGGCAVLPVCVGDPDELNRAVADCPNGTTHIASGRSVRATIAAVHALLSSAAVLRPEAALRPADSADSLAGVESVASWLVEVAAARVARLASAVVAPEPSTKEEAAADTDAGSLAGASEQRWLRLQALLARNEVIGRGGFGIVFSGHLPPFPGRVAVKVSFPFPAFCCSCRVIAARTHALSTLARQALRPDRALSGQYATLLRRELDIMLLLDHPNVLPLLDSYSRVLPAESGGLGSGADHPPPQEHYLVMPLMELGNLAAHLRRGRGRRSTRTPAFGATPMPSRSWEQPDGEDGRGPLDDGPARLRVARGIAAGLDYLHARSIFHRDMKPHNVLLGADLVPRIADFGLARAVDPAGLSRPSATMLTSHVMGTSGYDAPERVMGVFGPKTGAQSLWPLAISLATVRPGVSRMMIRCARAASKPCGQRDRATRPRDLFVSP